MKSFIIKQFVMPTITRLGTAVGLFLAGSLSVSPETANVIEMGLVAGAGVVVDLIVRQFGSAK